MSWGRMCRRAAAVASRKIRDLSGAGICSLRRIKMRVSPGFGVPEAAVAALACGEAAISSSLSASRRS